MFKHEKQLFHPVEVERPNPQFVVFYLGHDVDATKVKNHDRTFLKLKNNFVTKG